MYFLYSYRFDYPEGYSFFIAHVHFLNIKVCFCRGSCMLDKQAFHYWPVFPAPTAEFLAFLPRSVNGGNSSGPLSHPFLQDSSLTDGHRVCLWGFCWCCGYRCVKCHLWGGNSTRKVQQTISTVPGIPLKRHSTDLVMGSLRGNTLVELHLGLICALIMNRYLYNWTRCLRSLRDWFAGATQGTAICGCSVAETGLSLGVKIYLCK